VEEKMGTIVHSPEGRFCQITHHIDTKKLDEVQPDQFKEEFKVNSNSSALSQ
jgi:hypothetical protein